MTKNRRLELTIRTINRTCLLLIQNQSHGFSPIDKHPFVLLSLDGFAKTGTITFDVKRVTRIRRSDLLRVRIYDSHAKFPVLSGAK